MEFSRVLKYKSYGNDVLYIKKILFKLGYFSDKMKSIQSKSYGQDTVEAVAFFQQKHSYEDTGEIDEVTWNMIILASSEEDGDIEENTTNNEASSLPIPKNISSTAAAAIGRDLAKVSTIRQQICLDALQFAYDLNNVKPRYPLSLYIRGGNIYNKDLSLNIISLNYITNIYPNKYPSFVTDGRKEYLIKAVQEKSPISGADCSGGIVGLCRKYKVTSSSFDATANSLCSNTYSEAIDKAALKPGDWVGRDQHIGLYVGGGYVVEWIGGSFGCQLTVLNKRVVYDLQNGQKHTYSPWTKFRDPKCY